MEIQSASIRMQFTALNPSKAVEAGGDCLSDRAAECDESASGETLTATDETSGRQRDASSSSAVSNTELSEEDIRVLQQLKERDTEVRAHERAHVAAGGQYVTSQASYDYQIGPDGRRYAVGGEVGIDTSKIAGDPQATIEKARAISRAALAPAEPSTQDFRVAAAARAMELAALSEINQETQAQKDPETDETGARTMAVGESTKNTDDDPSSSVDARSRLEQRIDAFFAAPSDRLINQFA